MNDHTLPVVAGVEITTDSEGRYNLNALHRASGLGDNKRPSKWLASESAKKLNRELELQSLNLGFGENSNDYEPICVVHGGNAQGTYAAEQLAVAYANWISSAFYLQVIETFLATRKGRRESLPAPGQPSRAVRSAINRTRPSR